MLIEMIPPEYWPQMRRELNSLGDDIFSPHGKKEDAEARRIRINAEYDRAIKAKIIQSRRESKKRSKNKSE